MNDVMTNFGLNSKTWVGISLSSNNLLELVCLDKTTKMISKYASTEVQYNSAIREIEDPDEFIDKLQALFQQADLSPKNCNVLLNLPNVHFGLSTLAPNINDDEISEVLLSEVEDLYIFKKNDPMIEFQTIGRNPETEELLVVYSAIQRKTVDFVRECFSDLGANLVAVETANTSLLKGIQYSQFSSFDFTSTSILHISANSYSIFNFNNNNLIDYYEEPLAIKSFSNEEVYVAIANAASSVLSKYNAQNLLVISETDEISAELLASQVNFAGNIEYIDRNKSTNGCFIGIKPDVAIVQDQIPYITIESVGIAATMFEEFVLSFSFIHDSKVQDYETITIFGYELNFMQYAMAVILLGVIIAILINLLIGGYYSSKNNELKKEVNRIESGNNDLRQQIANEQKNKSTQDLFTVAKNIQDTNQSDFLMLKALSTDIPPSVWIEKFMLASDAFTTISGKSLSNEEIRDFFNSLQQRDPSLSLTRLDFNTDDANYVDGVFDFEMTNDAIASAAAESSMNNFSLQQEEHSAPSEVNDPYMNTGDPLMPQM